MDNAETLSWNCLHADALYQRFVWALAIVCNIVI